MSSAMRREVKLTCPSKVLEGEGLEGAARASVPDTGARDANQVPSDAHPPLNVFMIFIKSKQVGRI